MLSTFLTKQILAVIAMAILFCSGAYVVPQCDDSATPAVEATGVLG